ncbi:MAG: hypothetical protein A2508_05910 [Candidatus Lambdaproteobacteria bacterium RIFOXYD12_FULL_49_8]|uniref:Response regulatory domain-containing protein n=1 Tax=Candidatus Lambdaproteobacteria bacterium RIFOXYD2_FULL_50_16 TaxID=1817772 RepID=A0A1F6GAG7_9PROT|nr:MAG: hypothetical protein A2527_07985 [Candidatus Lambdaproteobacteria bacterium RIFOXYD2_FULL_50_16]OGG98071.1 MAG: hypothetical protein A2508_05910 [Candidatus Lambdaproteobacteria bacterium RIFOXYD12_FULL_49_8]
MAVNLTSFLIVDDQSSTRHVIKRALQTAGYSVFSEAKSGTEALNKLRESTYDLVILDWTMPGMSGIDVLKEIRHNPDWNNLKVIMVTAEGFKENVIEAVKAGANNYIVKPFTHALLLEKIERTLGANFKPVMG